MDKASIIVDAIEYIRDLQKNVEELQDELKELEDQADRVNDDEMEVCKRKRVYGSSIKMPSKALSRVSNTADKQTEVEVEVHEIGARELLLKLICSLKPSRFLKIMETLNSLGLQVIDANITTCNDRMLNILIVEGKYEQSEAVTKMVLA